MIPLRRFTARVLPVDDQGRVLLLYGFEPARPDERFWFTIGGALEEGETLQEAAARELREEVGISAEVSEFTGPYGTSTVEFSFAQYAITQDQTFFAVRVGAAEVSFDDMEEIEKATTVEHRWWSAEELEATDEVVHPPELAGLLRRITGGGGPA
ncbi:NUDIX hydrolase [Nonomuraea rhodomycinica]|uniref:NUDIX domain-containing protein n=1 Tax=Nonomuraea rhodomycinica TaxID=1712872 RepID=A0A7Y6IVQ4_9ACTN|nr:NUDIX domain-containing protein [Nonomuraea rhodomycinica]NUW44961.1 NUDIX domain-containing protein [Nonomuraea rhodomycinica]